jgi:Cd2+/Zn2+-exporting ATPase
LDALAKLKTIVLDKTGTLTKGNFKVTDVITVDGVSAEQILESVARAEGNSTHPIAKSIQEAYGKSFDNETIESFQELPSYGIQATVQDQEVIAGNDKILHHFDVPHTYHFCDIEGTIVHVAMNRNYVGYIVISDEVKPDTAEAVKYLRDLGITEMMILSGDDACVVENLAQSLGIEHFHANLLPEDKVSEVESMHDSGNVVAFVGDGINDAPVIAQADIGIAMGALGSDAAIETADIVLMTDSLIRVGSAIQIARKTRSIIWQNLIVIFGIKILFLLLGAFGLMTMWGAVFADVGLSILAVLNARRIISYIPKRPNSK